MDADGNGTVHADEFLAWARRCPGAIEIFGKISLDALREETTRHHEPKGFWAEAAAAARKASAEHREDVVSSAATEGAASDGEKNAAD